MFFNSTVVPVIFNSRDEQFKSPVGAVHPGDDITVTLLVSEELEPESVRAIVINDEDKTRKSFVMKKSETVIPTDNYLTFTVTVAPKKRGLYWYFFVVKTQGNEIVIGKTKDTNRAEFTNEPISWQQTVYDRDYDVPEWIKGGVFYHIFVDRFNRGGNEERIEMPGKINRTDWGAQPFYKPDEHGEIKNNDFFGGNLRGIEEKLDYLKDLGVTCLYLSPIFEAYSNHKYDTADYMKIDPMFGTEEDFRRLCEKVHEKGMHLILDGVFSHTGSDSIYFDKNKRFGGGAYDNPKSKYRDWYYFINSHGYETWWGIDTLPRVNKDNPEYVEFINGKDGVVRHWLRLGADGWRLDVVDELPNDFVKKLAGAAKEEKKDSLIIGEVWEDASNKVAYGISRNYFDGDKLDSVMNYPFKNAIINYIRHGNANEIRNEIEQIIENYPKEVLDCLMNILGTHDTQRILSALADRRLPDNAPRVEQAHFRLNDMEKAQAIKRLKIASVIQMTLPGVPCIYYADEAGVEGGKDPFNRTCFPWGHENRDLQEWYRKIIRIRRENDIYADGSYRTVSASNGLFAFERRKGASALITAANCGYQEETLVMAGTWKDLLTDRTYHNNITVFPGEVLLLKINRTLNPENQQNIKTKGGLLNGIHRTIRKVD